MLKTFQNPLTRREAVWAYVMIAPMILGLAVFFYLALVASLGISFTKWDVLTQPIWVGLQNYIDLFNNELFRKSLGNTFLYTFMSVPLGLVISGLLALALNSKIRFRNVYRLIFFLPVLTMPVAISVVWNWLYNPDFGLLNQFLSNFGVAKIRWLTDPRWTMWSLVIMSTWMGVGYGMVIFLAGLQNIPREFYEAAEVDGASNWHKLRYVTLPLLTPTIFFNMLTSMIGALQVFDIIYTMTKGGPLNTTRSIVYMIYQDGFRNFRMGAASSMAWVLFVIILIITIIQFRVQKRWVHYA